MDNMELNNSLRNEIHKLKKLISEYTDKISKLTLTFLFGIILIVSIEHRKKK